MYYKNQIYSRVCIRILEKYKLISIIFWGQCWLISKDQQNHLHKTVQIYQKD